MDMKTEYMADKSAGGWLLTSRSQNIRFGIIQASYWCSIASLPVFAVAYVRSKGISATYIGIMLAVFMLSAVVGQFFWGAICDRFQSNKKVFILTNALLLCVSILFYLSPSPVMLLSTYAILGFIQSPTNANMDTNYEELVEGTIAYEFVDLKTVLLTTSTLQP